jgi:NAD(P)-dependent dehydrogenase (short-subunit alcohol dehydrogenase family)
MTTATPRFALISGASSGFGLELALELARGDWTVFAGIRRPQSEDEVLAAAADANVAHRIRPLHLDVTDSASIRSAMALVQRENRGCLDLLVNNAGYTDIAFFEDMGDSQCRAIMETNFFGAVSLTRAVLPGMRAMRRGRIGFVSSNAVNVPHPTMTMYAASKWAMEGFAEGLAMEVAPLGIEVVVLEPGNYRTPFGSKVNLLRTENSGYSSIWDKVLPNLGRLAQVGADPSAAIDEFVRVLTSDRPPFLTVIGEDARLFSRLKRTTDYESRAKLLRRFIGFPGRPHAVANGTDPVRYPGHRD